MKKVLFTATVDSHILHFHIPFLKMFHEKGYEVHVATNGNEKIPYCDVKHIVSFERSPLKINNLLAIRQLKKIIETENFDIIHTHTPMGAAVTRLAAKNARKNGTRVIYTAHGFHFYKGAPIKNWILFYPIEKTLAKYTDTLITINREDYTLARLKFHKCKDIKYVPGVGVDFNKFELHMSSDERHLFRESLGLNDDDFVIIYVAELNKNKNQFMAINAMRKLVDVDDKIKLLLVGSGALESKYKELVCKLNLNNNVIFTGYRKDVPKLMHISNLAISTSQREGLPVNLMEAGMCGLPIVATNCRGNRDVVMHDKNGYLINLNSADELVNVILDNYKSNNMSLSYSSKMVKQYELKSVTKLMEDIYFNNDKKKIKILHVVNAMNCGGTENMIMNIYRLLDKDKFEFDFAVQTMDECFFDNEIKHFGGNIYHFSKFNGTNYFQYRKEWKKFFTEHCDYDIVHGHVGSSAYIYLHEANRCNIATIAHSHSTGQLKNFKDFIWNMFCFPTRYISKYFFACSDEAGKKRYGRKIVNKNNYFMISNGIDMEKYKFSSDIRSEMRKKFNISGNDIVFGHVGRFDEAKNQIFAIKLFKELNFENSHLFLLGDGILKSKLEDYVLRENIKNVHFLGVVSDTYKYYQMFDVFLFPSMFEGLPVSVIEAQSSGLNCYLSDSITSEAKFNDNVSFLSLDDMNQWKSKLLGDKLLNYDRTKISNKLVEKYDIRKSTKHIENLYKNIITTKEKR